MILSKKKKKHRKYMELLGRIRKVENMKDTFEAITARNDYKSGLEDGLEWALSILQDRETDLQLKMERFPDFVGKEPGT